MRQFLCNFLMIISLADVYVMVVFSMTASHFNLDTTIKHRVNFLLDLVLVTTIFVGLAVIFLL